MYSDLHRGMRSASDRSTGGALLQQEKVWGGAAPEERG